MDEDASQQQQGTATPKELPRAQYVYRAVGARVLEHEEWLDCSEVQRVAVVATHWDWARGLPLGPDGSKIVLTNKAAKCHLMCVRHLHRLVASSGSREAALEICRQTLAERRVDLHSEGDSEGGDGRRRKRRRLDAEEEEDQTQDGSGGGGGGGKRDGSDGTQAASGHVMPTSLQLPEELAHMSGAPKVKQKIRFSRRDFKDKKEGRLGLEHFIDSANLPSRELYHFIHHKASGAITTQKLFQSSSLTALGVLFQEYCQYMVDRFADQGTQTETTPQHDRDAAAGTADQADTAPRPSSPSPQQGLPDPPPAAEQASATTLDDHPRP